MKQHSDLPIKLLILISFLQSLALLLLHQSVEFGFWPNQSPQWLVSLYSIALAVPVMLLLSLKKDRRHIVRVMRLVAPIALVFALAGYYTGFQANPVDIIRIGQLYSTYAVSMTVLLFMVLIYLQHYAYGGTLSYELLFSRSWRNFLTLGLSLLFATLTWAVLMLWAALFKAIKVDFFYDLFTECWFYYPTIGLAHGLGIVIFRSQSAVIDTITRLLRALIRYLLILLVFIAVIFLCALPFTGLQALWDSGGSLLILWMQALLLFFVNAVYQGDRDNKHYHPWLHRFIWLGVALLPAYSIISFYGLSLRFEQYGWSLARGWAFLIWAIISCFSVGYLFAIFKLRDGWLAKLGRINVVVGWILMALLLAVNSPLLDFRKLTVSNQMTRLDEKEATEKSFDVNYFRYQLARPGYLALLRIKEDLTDKYPNLVLRIEGLGMFERNEDSSKLLEMFSKRIEGRKLAPDSLIQFLFNRLEQEHWLNQNAVGYYLAPLDLNGDGKDEFIYFTETADSVDARLCFQEENQWKMTYLTSKMKSKNLTLLDAIKAGDLVPVQPKWNDVLINGQRFTVEQ